MVGNNRSRTPARLRLAALLLATPLAVMSTSVVAGATPAPMAPVAQTLAAPAGAAPAVWVDRSKGRDKGDKGDRGDRGDKGGDRGGDRGGHRRGDRESCGLLGALLFGC
ncbi:MAG TPA: hypothetical protein VGP96_09865 [Candidatus Dormibacteraeota bacterium]|nr:hypothetical protein [Candidatus Dormibacteraeota bacterium]